MHFDTDAVRAQFPALALRFPEYNDQPAVFFDSPGGTQVPQSVIDAVSGYYRDTNANGGGTFLSSQRTDAVARNARQAMADLLNAPDPDTILFGPSMTTLTFHLANAIRRTLKPGDEIVVTTLDHDANVTPWTDLEEAGAIIKVVDIYPDDSTLDMESFAAALTSRTRLVAVTHASNATGTIPNVAEIVRMAHAVGALVFIDAVQFSPHGLIDVQALDCDFLACSAYKFFGPHIGVLYGKREHLERFTPQKVRPAKDVIPYRWEMGTPNYEGLAGTAAAIDHMAEVYTHTEGAPMTVRQTSDAESERSISPVSLTKNEWQGEGSGVRASVMNERRRNLEASMNAIQQYEQSLAGRLIAGLQRFDDLKIYGLTDTGRAAERVPTVAFTWKRLAPRPTAAHLAVHGIHCWSGNYYALRLMERLGLEETGGAVRIGLAHYNTIGEIDRLLAVLDTVPKLG